MRGLEPGRLMYCPNLRCDATWENLATDFEVSTYSCESCDGVWRLRRRDEPCEIEVAILSSHAIGLVCHAHMWSWSTSTWPMPLDAMLRKVSKHTQCRAMEVRAPLLEVP
jgi:hypothetical protein